jgi:dUTP pyrophosphatase
MIKHAITLASGGHLYLEDVKENQIQPNAIDITCDKVYQSYKTTGLQPGFTLTKDKTTHLVKHELLTAHQFSKLNVTDTWKLDGKVFYFESNLKITVPYGYVAWLMPRSSLNRNGIRVESGLYDSGFTGNVAGTIYVHTGLPFTLERGARIAQLIFAEADTLHKYSGQYQGK